ncbi:MAG: hypothetical protein AAF849_23240 [Bacteroidota bacterium]
MDITTTKSKLHTYIDRADQPFLRIVEVMFEQYFKEQNQSTEDREAQLIRQIQTEWNPIARQRFHELTQKRQDEIITTDEYNELLELVDEMENYTAQRTLYVTELAKLRGVSARELMTELSLK